MEEQTHKLEQERDALLQEAAKQPGVAEAIKLQQSVLESAALREKVALAYEPQAHYGVGFAQPR